MRRRRVRRRRAWTIALSVAGHVGMFSVLALRPDDPPRVIEPEPMIVQLVDAPRPPAPTPGPAPGPPQAQASPPAAAPTPKPPAPAKPAPRRISRPVPAPPDVEPLYAGEDDAPDVDGSASDLTDAQLAGATTAGSGGAGGGGGGTCNMTQWLQAALRKDPLVQAAAAQAHRGKAIMVWNGDWIRRPGQEGQGLAAVREAIMWEVGFAPLACRTQPVRGLVLISLNDAPGSARLVVGSERWRWSDLLFARGGGNASSR